jgi:hypothetical protein
MNEPGADFPLFCGNQVSPESQILILGTINRFPGLARTELASTLCELLNWVRPNGKLKTVECRQFLELLHKQNMLTLPNKHPRSKRRKSHIKLTQMTETAESLHGSLKDYGPMTLRLVQQDADKTLWKELIERHHYLGCRLPFGAHLRYFIQTTQPNKKIVGCLQFSSPAWRMAARDQWIGWSDTVRGDNLQRIISNSRFLLLPHVNIKNLASHVLSLAARQVSDDWQAVYHIKPLLIETLVDQEKFFGGCYRAANWVEVGSTAGRGRQDRQHKRHNAAPKRIVLYPLQKNVQQQLQMNLD